jgi:hypothetical protein
MAGKSNKAVAELFFDLKGHKLKRLDWMSIADRCEEVAMEFHSKQKASEKLGVSMSLFNSILRLKKLDSRVQEMVRRREILFDSAQRLNAITKAEGRQYEVAKMLIGASNKQQREIIQQAKRFPDSDLVDYRNRVLGNVVKKEKIRVLIIPMREGMYQSLEGVRRKMNKPVEKLLSEIIGEWLSHRAGALK